MLMPNDSPTRVEVITGVAGRRYWPAHEKLRIVEESLVPGESVSAVAKRNGVAPNLLFRWRCLIAEGGAMAVGKNEPVVDASEVRKLEDRVRDLERLPGRKMMEVEILKEAREKAGAKDRCGCHRRRARTVPSEPGDRDDRGQPLSGPGQGYGHLKAARSLPQGRERRPAHRPAAPRR